MPTFESLTAAQVAALPPTSRAAYERWFWQWMNDNQQADFEADVATERKEGYAYDHD